MNKNATESNLRIENEERFNKIFAKDVDGNPSPAYTNYIEGAKKVWRIYSDKYRLWTRGSLEGKPLNTQKGKNRGVEIYDGDVHLVGFSVQLKCVKLYVLDSGIRSKLPLDYHVDPSGEHWAPARNIDEALDMVKDVL